MATEPTLALQIAFVAALKTAAVGAQVYDKVPTSAVAAPYVVVGDDHFLPDQADGFYGGEIASNVHVYYAANLGKAGVKPIVGKVAAALESTHDMGADFAAHPTRYVGVQYQDEPDGKTSHAIVAFSTLFDTARDAA